MSPEAATAISVIAAAAISGGFVWHTQRDGNKVAKMRTVLEAYDGIVKNLQSEVERMRHDLEAMRIATEECENRSEMLANELAELKAYVAERHPEKIAADRKKPGPKPGTKRAAATKKAQAPKKKA